MKPKEWLGIKEKESYGMSKKMNLFRELSEYYPFKPEELEKIITNQMLNNGKETKSLINPETLNQERLKGYEVWFERWWNSHDVEQRLLIAAKRGLTSSTTTMKFHEGMSEDKRHNMLRKNDPEFIRCLEKKLPGFKISEAAIKGILGNVIGKNVTISWRDVND